jgi:hypothetical protein
MTLDRRRGTAWPASCSPAGAVEGPYSARFLRVVPGEIRTGTRLVGEQEDGHAVPPEHMQRPGSVPWGTGAMAVRVR